MEKKTSTVCKSVCVQVIRRRVDVEVILRQVRLRKEVGKKVIPKVSMSTEEFNLDQSLGPRL